MASRRIHPLWTSAGMEAVGCVCYLTALALFGAWPQWQPGVVPWGIVLAALGGASLLVMYAALARGPIAVVSPVIACYTAVTVLLIVVFLGERLTLGETMAIGVTFAGVVLASTDIRRVRSLSRHDLGGIPLGFIAMLGFGLWGAISAAATRTYDPLLLVLVVRIAGAVVMGTWLVAARVGMPADRSARAVGLVVTVGVFDTAANVMFVQGFALGDAAIVATASGIYPVLPAFLAIVLLGERLAASQYAGVAILIAGLVALGLTRPPL